MDEGAEKGWSVLPIRVVRGTSACAKIAQTPQNIGKNHGQTQKIQSIGRCPGLACHAPLVVLPGARSGQLFPSTPPSGIDIRTVQTLLGHSYVSKTMIYAHVLKVAVGGACSPLDALELGLPSG